MTECNDERCNHGDCAEWARESSKLEELREREYDRLEDERRGE